MKRKIVFLAGIFCAALPVHAATTQEMGGIILKLDQAAGAAVGFLAKIFFADILFFIDGVSLPFTVAWLIAGAVYFTIRMGFVNVRLFRHAVEVARGRYDNPADVGEVTHFQALSAALSATVGLGNIAGVAIAVSLGGPGAMFWMIIAGLLGMSSKFTEVTLGLMYREIRHDGKVMGGAMEYLSKGLAELGKPRLGKILAVLFAVLCIGGSLGGGNAFQVGQSLNALQETSTFFRNYPYMYGLLMVFLVGVVILGGIRRIAKTAEMIVPFMCGIYILACLWIVFLHLPQVPAALGIVVKEAFTPQAAYGGFLGVLVIGFQRASFSNEAGIGSAPIAHSAAKTPYPVREGVVGLLEPFIDTVVVCSMTAIVIVVTGAYNNPAYADIIQAKQGAALTSRAFGEHLSWFPYVLSLSVVLFAYSTMISWSYYGERCWAYLFGDEASIYYKFLFLFFVFLGSVITSANVLDLSDLMILGMAFPNILGVFLLSPKVRAALDEYVTLLKAGKFPKYR